MADIPAADAPRLSGGGANAVFLHTGWRSCGTWIWSRLRENPAMRAFYEPLHEDLATIRRADIGAFRPNSWQSGHSSTAAYFAEYERLLNRHGRGVAGYRRHFAFDRFFLEPDEAHPALEAYVRRLLDAARAEGRIPVLKFCRSQGRAAWLRQFFPDALHLTVLRDPGAQWESSRQQYVQHGNRYFLLAPFVILARNASHPLVADALTRLEVAAPVRFGRNLGMSVDASWHHVKRLSWDDRYRGFMACWSAAAVSALRSDAAVIDATALTTNAAYRQGVADMIAAAIGCPVSLETQAGQAVPATAAARPVSAGADMARANHAAAGFIAAHAHTLPPAHAALLRDMAVPVPGMMPRSGSPAMKPLARQHAMLHYIDTALYIALLRLSFPLRRLHGTLDRLWSARQAARSDKKNLRHSN